MKNWALVLVAASCVFMLYGARRLHKAHATPAPCTDALGALIDSHPECGSELRYVRGAGYVLRCLGGDIVVSDVIASAEGAMSSFLYTNARTMRQGICDCDKPEGNACEELY